MTEPIGIFDSGVGGTSILKEINELLPSENIIYLADSKNAPYGEKPPKDIVALSKKNTEYLLSKQCKLIVVACNTATTNAISFLRNYYTVPFIGIEPAIKPAALNSKTGSIGILATKGTLSSSLFHRTSDLFARNIKVTEQIGNGLVELIEAGKLHSPEMRSLLKSYLKPMLAAEIDHLVLGCTHYSFLIPNLHGLLPEGVKIIDSARAVARQTKRILGSKNLQSDASANGKVQLLTNGNPVILKNLIEERYQIRIENF